MQISRRGFLLALLGSAATGMILKDTELLALPVAPNKYFEAVRRARQLQTVPFLWPQFRHHIYDCAVLVTCVDENYYQVRERLTDFLEEVFAEATDVSSADVEALFAGERAKWDMLDIANLQKLADAVVPLAILRAVAKEQPLIEPARLVELSPFKVLVDWPGYGNDDGEIQYPLLEVYLSQRPRGSTCVQTRSAADGGWQCNLIPNGTDKPTIVMLPDACRIDELADEPETSLSPLS